MDFYGDAMVEAWRGTQHGEPHSRCLDAPDIFDAHFGKEFANGLAGSAASLVPASVPRPVAKLGVVGIGSLIALWLFGKVSLTSHTFMHFAI